MVAISTSPETLTKATVIIAAYNAERFLKAALQSASRQTEKNLQIIVVDDCSTDRTAEIVREAIANDSRIQLLRTSENGGPSTARNLGLDASTGEWIALLDADDTMAADRLEALIDLADRRQADMAADNLVLVPEADPAASSLMISARQLDKEIELNLTEFIKRNTGGSRHKRLSYGFLKPILRRSFLQQHDLKYDEQIRFAEDFSFYVDCLGAGATWWLRPEALYNYTLRESSLTEVQTSHDLDRLRQRQRRLLAQAQAAEDPALVQVTRAHLKLVEQNYYYRTFTDALKERQFIHSRKILLSSPASVRLIVIELLRQAPTIARKALCGGYG